MVAPGSGINHPGQTNELRPLLAHLPAGVKVSDIAYAWAFTTQSVTRDLEAIVTGLNSGGRLAILGNQYPVQISAPEIGQGAYRTVMQVFLEREGVPVDRTAAAFRLPAGDFLAFLGDPAVAPLFGSPDPAQLAALAASFQYIDYFVSGAYVSPSFLDVNVDQSVQDTSFQLDLNARTVTASIPVGMVPSLVIFDAAVISTNRPLRVRETAT